MLHKHHLFRLCTGKIRVDDEQRKKDQNWGRFCPLCSHTELTRKMQLLTSNDQIDGCLKKSLDVSSDVEMLQQRSQRQKLMQTNREKDDKCDKMLIH